MSSSDFVILFTHIKYSSISFFIYLNLIMEILFYLLMTTATTVKLYFGKSDFLLLFFFYCFISFRILFHLVFIYYNFNKQLQTEVIESIISTIYFMIEFLISIASTQQFYMKIIKVQIQMKIPLKTLKVVELASI